MLCNFQPITKHGVEHILRILSFASSKSPGPGGTSPSDLKCVAKTISGTPAVLFNISLATGEVPQDFKIGNSILLLKRGKKDTTNPVSYRGINSNSILSKAQAKLVLRQIGKFLEDNEVFSELQYEFRKGLSTIDLLTAVVDDQFLARGKNLFTAVVLTDLSKSFDIVQHPFFLIMLQMLPDWRNRSEVALSLQLSARMESEHSESEQLVI